MYKTDSNRKKTNTHISNSAHFSDVCYSSKCQDKEETVHFFAVMKC